MPPPAVGAPVCTPEDHPGDTDTLVALYHAWGQPSLENWLSRQPIGDWEGVSTDMDGRVAALNLQRAGLAGALPGEVGNLAGLRLLDLAGNALTGELPEELGDLARLEILDIGGTSLTINDGACAPNVNSLSLGFSYLAPPGELCVTGGEFVSVDVGGWVPSGSGARASACAIKTDGSVVCWHNSVASQAMSSEGYSPPLSGKYPPPEGGFHSVSSGASHSCGVRRNGSVACWGLNTDGQATPPQGPFTSVSVGIGYDYTCGVKIDGSGVCWGNYSSDHLPPDGEFASVSVEVFSSCWLKTDGSLVGCASGDYQPTGEFTSVSAGRSSGGGRVICGLKTNSSIECWGGGTGDYQPTGEFASVSVGDGSGSDVFVCGLRQDGSVVCWRYGPPGLRHNPPPAGEFVSVSSKASYICQVRAAGSVVCWSYTNNPWLWD